MSLEKPFIPFYKPYGMSDEEYEYEIKQAEHRLYEWEIEQEKLFIGEQKREGCKMSNEEIKIAIETEKIKIKLYNELLKMLFNPNAPELKEEKNNNN